MITLNESPAEKKFSFTDGSNNFTATLPAGSVATLVW
jgi:O-glycosyl hydrolase